MTNIHFQPTFSVKTFLDMMERLEDHLAAGARKLEEMLALVKKLSVTKLAGLASQQYQFWSILGQNLAMPVMRKR